MSLLPKVTVNQKVLLPHGDGVSAPAREVTLRVSALPSATAVPTQDPTATSWTQRMLGLSAGYASAVLKIAEGTVRGAVSAVVDQAQLKIAPLALLNQAPVAQKISKLTHGASDAVLKPWVAMGEIHAERSAQILNFYRDPLGATTRLGQKLHRDLAANPLRTFEDTFRFGETGLMAATAVLGLSRGSRFGQARRWDDVIDLPRSAWSRVNEAASAAPAQANGVLPKSAAPVTTTNATYALRPYVSQPVTGPVMNHTRNAFWPQAIAMPKDPDGLGRADNVRPNSVIEASSQQRQSSTKSTEEFLAYPHLDAFLLSMPPQLYAQLLQSLQPVPTMAVPTKKADPVWVAKALLEAPSGTLLELAHYLQQQIATRTGAAGTYKASSPEAYARMKSLVGNNRGRLGAAADWLAHVLKPGEDPVQSLKALIKDRAAWAQGRSPARQINDSLQVVADLMRVSAQHTKVLEGLARGLTPDEIAPQIGVKPSSAREHAYKILQALGAFSPLDLKNRYTGGLPALAQKIEEIKQQHLSGPPIEPTALDALPRSHLPVLADLVAGVDRTQIRQVRGLSRETLNDYVATLHTRLGVKDIDQLKARYAGADLHADVLQAFARRSSRQRAKPDPVYGAVTHPATSTATPPVSMKSESEE